MNTNKKKNKRPKFVVYCPEQDYHGNGDTLEEAFEDLNMTGGTTEDEDIYVYELKGALGRKTVCELLKLGSFKD